ncbi:helix-turn-helix domain-containing protein [Dactylosporangium sp. CA-233914]|uniref:helix-turn-helix domain-containing protein n=1 Tax=Dactylosporangium sp. CA-233914 TaxID=3239934 RepID=UPI003D947367
MIRPYVRRLRLARDLHRLRDERGMSAEHLARVVGIPRQRISGIENCHVRPDDDELTRILNALEVAEGRRTAILAVAADARHRGWWEKIAETIGPRQALYADLEAGASAIFEYQLTLLPGLLQIPAFTATRARADRPMYPEGFDPERAVEARAARQAVLHRDDAPEYEVLIDELAIRRFAAGADVVREQLDHLAFVGHEHPHITIRVLPFTARITEQLVPRSAFSVYRYPDPNDPVVVAVDTITSDLVLTQPVQISHYQRLYQHLRDVALTPADSLDFLATVAEELLQTG